MQILAISDMDALFGDYKPFEKALAKEKEPDLVLIAGDLTRWGSVEDFLSVAKPFEKAKWKCPIIACLGNHEPENAKEIFLKYSKRIEILEDEATEISIKGEKITIIGSRGSLDDFGIGHYIDFASRQDIEARLKKIEALLKKTKGEKVLLTHYAPTFKTLEGEHPSIWGGMADPRMEDFIRKYKLLFCVHGHAHYGKEMDFVGSTPIFNSAFTLRNGFLHIDTKRLPRG